MHKKILGRLCCPACKGDLIAASFLESQDCAANEESNHSVSCDRDTVDNNIIEYGVLLCDTCKKWFPIYSYVPVMLLYKTALHAKFADRYGGQLKKYSGYSMPDSQPRPGELSTQSTFSAEWDLIKWQEDELSFTYTADELIMLNRQVWLKWLNTHDDQVNTVLNVGCGLGQEAIALKETVKGCEVYAIDINFAILKSGGPLKCDPQIHLVLSSLFDIPFKDASFDLVYSQGVIHHTYSTHDALKTISAFVKPGGFLFIWVYGLADHLVLKGYPGFLSKLLYATECLFRPVVSRLPGLLRDIFFNITSVILHPAFKTIVRHDKTWTFRNTNHSLRDTFSPKYAHRQDYNQVIEWYEDLGFSVIDIQSPAAYRKLFGTRLWGVGLTGQK